MDARCALDTQDRMKSATLWKNETVKDESAKVRKYEGAKVRRCEEKVPKCEEKVRKYEGAKIRRCEEKVRRESTKVRKYEGAKVRKGEEKVRKYEDGPNGIP